MADSNQVALRYIEETEWGTTPASALTNLRRTGDSLQEMETNTESSEIITDRQLRDMIRTGRGSQGGADFELSYGSFDVLHEHALCDAFASNVLENGVTRKSLTLEKEIQVEGSPASHFLTFPGFRIGTLSLDMSLDSIITGSFTGMGKAMLSRATTAGSGSPVAAPSTEPISVVDLSAIEEGGQSLPGVTAFSLAVNNNLRRQGALGSVNPYGIALGSFRVDGSISMYFQDRALLDKYIGRTATAFEVTVTDAAGNAITYLIPRARLVAPTIQTGTLNTDVIATFPFHSIKDAGSTEKMIVVSRAAA